VRKSGTEEAGSRNLQGLETGTLGSWKQELQEAVRNRNRRSWKQEPSRAGNRDFGKLEAGTSGSRQKQEPEATGS
jgi:hypothetical protein